MVGLEVLQAAPRAPYNHLGDDPIQIDQSYVREAAPFTSWIYLLQDRKDQLMNGLIVCFLEAANEASPCGKSNAMCARWRPSGPLWLLSLSCSLDESLPS